MKEARKPKVSNRDNSQDDSPSRCWYLIQDDPKQETVTVHTPHSSQNSLDWASIMTDIDILRSTGSSTDRNWLQDFSIVRDELVEVQSPFCTHTDEAIINVKSFSW